MEHDLIKPRAQERALLSRDTPFSVLFFLAPCPRCPDNEGYRFPGGTSERNSPRGYLIAARACAGGLDKCTPVALTKVFPDRTLARQLTNLLLMAIAACPRIELYGYNIETQNNASRARQSPCAFKSLLLVILISDRRNET